MSKNQTKLLFAVVLLVLVSPLILAEKAAEKKDGFLSAFNVVLNNDARVVCSLDGKLIVTEYEIAERKGYNLTVSGSKNDGKNLQIKGPNGELKGNAGSASFHPEGRLLVFQAEDTLLELPENLAKTAGITLPRIGVHHNIWVLSFDPLSYTKLTSVSNGGGAISPRFSAKGDKLAWCELINQDGKTQRWVIKSADFKVDNGSCSISDIRSLATKGIEPRCVYGFINGDSSILFGGAKEGTKNPQAIYTLDLTSGKTSLLTEGDEWNDCAQLSPDGRYILYCSSADQKLPEYSTTTESLLADNPLEIWVMTVDGQHRKRISSFSDATSPEYAFMKETSFVSSFSLLPDSKTVYASVRLKNGAKKCLQCNLSPAAFDFPFDAASYRRNPGPYKTKEMLLDWHDKNRKRDVPVKIYLPVGNQEGESFPIIIFSHGAGGSREAYSYLGMHWSSWGFVSVHLQHIGSDDSVWRGKANPYKALQEAIAKPENAINRPKDVSFAIDTLIALNKADGEFKGKFDTARIGMSGHSFGAFTTLVAIGQSSGTRIPLSLEDPRIKAAVILSPTVTDRRDAADKIYGSIRVPSLHMTGTLDTSSLTPNTKAADRRIPYDNIKLSDQYLVIFDGGDHMVFSGRGNQERRPIDALFQPLIRQGSTVFFESYLKDEPQSRAWLVAGSFKAVLDKYATFEMKLK